MAYKVTGAAAVVELDDGKADLNTGKKVYLEEGGYVPDGAKQASVDHLVAVGLITEVDGQPPAEAPADSERSSRSRSGKGE